MSLLDMLLNEPSAAERAMGVIASMQSAGGHDPRSSADIGTTPPGRGIFGNDVVDVLGANDPRLVSRFGVTLARPAMRSLADVLGQLNYRGDAGGGYRTSAEQAALRAAKPGLAAPVGSSFHQEGLAIDLAAALQNPRAFNLLRQAGWNQLEGEPWHWSSGVYG
jgi:hypothetical protein